MGGDSGNLILLKRIKELETKNTELQAQVRSLNSNFQWKKLESFSELKATANSWGTTVSATYSELINCRRIMLVTDCGCITFENVGKEMCYVWGHNSNTGSYEMTAVYKIKFNTGTVCIQSGSRGADASSQSKISEVYYIPA